MDDANSPIFKIEDLRGNIWLNLKAINELSKYSYLFLLLVFPLIFLKRTCIHINKNLKFDSNLTHVRKQKIKKYNQQEYIPANLEQENDLPEHVWP